MIITYGNFTLFANHPISLPLDLSVVIGPHVATFSREGCSRENQAVSDHLGAVHSYSLLLCTESYIIEIIENDWNLRY